MGSQLNSELSNLRPGCTETLESEYGPNTQPHQVESCLLFLSLSFIDLVSSASVSLSIPRSLSFLVLFSAKLASLPVICLSALPSLLLLFSVIAKAMIWLEDRQTDWQARRGEADSAVEGGVDGGVGLRAGGRAGREEVGGSCRALQRRHSLSRVGIQM